MPRPVPFRGIRYRCFHCEHPAIDEDVCWNCGQDPMSPQSREEIRRRMERARRQAEADDAAMRAFVQQSQARLRNTAAATWTFPPEPPPIHDPLSNPPIPNPDRVMPVTEEQRRAAEITQEQFIYRAEMPPPPDDEEDDDDDDYQYMPDDDDDEDDDE